MLARFLRGLVGLPFLLAVAIFVPFTVSGPVVWQETVLGLSLSISRSGLIIALDLVLRGLLATWLALVAWLLALPLAVRLLPALAGRVAPAGLVGRLLRAVRETGPADIPELARLYLWTALSWASKLAAFAAITAHFLDGPAGTILAGIVGAELSSVLPFHGVAGAGSYEAAMVAALYPFGVQPAAALGAAVNLHLFLLGVTLISSLAALLIPAPRAGTPAEPVAEEANRA